ncbi:MAG: M48 family metalloprotease [Cellvibrionaceae bacterium]|nr:M48 family metalloprotease [Cellvibrionaceae bacterium]
MNKCCYHLLVLMLSLPLSTVGLELPSIGEVDNGSQIEEKRLGAAWLRQYRRQVPLESDPIIIDYTERLLQRVATKTRLNPEDLSLVVVKNPTLNAFAVPGGIIGVHTGLFQYAQTEAQFASVLAHELAHLTQRHYARSVEQRKGQQLTNMAALLAGLVLIATAQGDAGLAALSTAQASMIDQQLRFSRSFEEEADRLGMDTLVEAGYPPEAVAQMFEQMLRASRFSTQAPEFLLTHPITTKRLADATNRARKLSVTAAEQNPTDYDLVRARALFKLSPSPQHAIKRFEAELRGISPSETGSRYGLILALIADGQFERAQALLSSLRNTRPKHPILLIAQSEIHAGQQQLSDAINVMATARQEADSYALQIQHSRLLATAQDHAQGAQILTHMSQQHPNDPTIWYHLAELSGLSGNILNLHKARAEYYVLFGQFDKALRQLNNIIEKYADNKAAIASAQQRIREIKELKKTTAL